MGQSLEMEVGAMRLVPFSDRPIEAEHVYLGAVTVGTYRGLRFSAAHRFKLIADSLSNSQYREALLNNLVQLEGDRWDPRRCVRMLSMDNHPALFDWCNVRSARQQGAHPSDEGLRVFELLLYRQTSFLKDKTKTT